MSDFQLVTRFKPAGDQPEAIRQMVEGLEAGLSHQTLLGVTGSGKTFSIANVIAQVQRPTLVLAPNKTLAAQLYGEFKAFFPNNAVEYFVSYYDYYQPEAYVPSSDTFIEKDSSMNEHIEQMRLSATKALMERRDTIIVASVSAISEDIRAIAASSGEQSAGLRKINEAVTKLDQVTQQNAAMVEESTAASHGLAQEAQSLAELLAQFKLGGTISQATSRPAPVAAGDARATQDKVAKAIKSFPTRGNAAVKADDWEEF